VAQRLDHFQFNFYLKDSFKIESNFDYQFKRVANLRVIYQQNFNFGLTGRILFTGSI
jgi:hypothetical protein